MGLSETFGIEKNFGTKVVEWLNTEALSKKYKIEFRLYGYEIITENFGSFEMISWMGDVQYARKLITRASKRFKIKAIEGGYKPAERTYLWRRSDYAMVRRGDTVIGQLELVAPRFGNSKWKIRAEERK
ncbi:MAG: hypothetical protein K8823_552 [Cenarchaeum symbiont of Oopsacas minuta]|nr:hypothetical protein [Cenarchaeum symbiont of Oopsacas minuta]